MIHLDNVTRMYDNFTAVDKVSFDITGGEIVGLLGHNGAGKTTIMKMLTGYIEPSVGSIVIDGMALDESTEAVQQLIGYLPENLPVYPELNIVDYLSYCAKVRNIPKAKQEAAIARAIGLTELQEKALQPIATLSRGFKQRVGVAQALIHKPKILILDEPTNGLDPHQTRQMRELIRNLSGTATVILSTHIMQEVDALCDRVLILDSGALALNESMDTLRRSEILQLDTDADEKTLQAALPKGNKLQCSAQAHCQRYQISITPEDNIQDLASTLTHSLVTGGAKVFAIHPLLRDLETVFRTIHENRSAEEMTHAA